MKMKTLQTITALTFAALFTLTANAGSVSGQDYESYVSSASWPGDSVSSSTNIADIQDALEQSPTAAGYGGERIFVDLMGEDIHAQ